ncbi:hypothetical protein J7481_22845 [Labrenzia sp. R4_2]|uniref:hypothetical protein n=1 Tax=Labrenzia sp. R4_2 TaxID=2821107 RepID=UPI001ADBB456|nr:hypothetical protein [Labrenzia sp. R4_2]MBO9422367.1 hypothetical protein [Labrenzia sp. R4_2]
MTQLAKLTFTTVKNLAKQKDPILERRKKLVAGIEEQLHVFAAMAEGQDYKVEKSKWITNETGERVQTKIHRRIAPWFFEQDGGWYVQCRYGARVLLPNGKDNAVFVKKFDSIADILKAFCQAANEGELDTAMAAVMVPKAKAN